MDRNKEEIMRVVSGEANKAELLVLDRRTGERTVVAAVTARSWLDWATLPRTQAPRLTVWDVAERVVQSHGMIMAPAAVGRITLVRRGGALVWQAEYENFDRWVAITRTVGDERDRRLVDWFDHPFTAVEEIFRVHRTRQNRRPRPVVTDGQPAMYVVTGDGNQWERRKDGRPISLVEAMRDSYGVAGRNVYRIEPGGRMVPVVKNAGDPFLRHLVGRDRKARR